MLLVGNFGAKSLATMEFPIITLMSTIQFEGNFLKRMDALMVAVWFFTLYALLNLHLHYAVMMCRETKCLSGKKRLSVVTVGVAVYVVACFMEYMKEGIEGFITYYSVVAAPLMIVGPMLLLIGNRSKKKGAVE